MWTELQEIFFIGNIRFGSIVDFDVVEREGVDYIRFLNTNNRVFPNLHHPDFNEVLSKRILPCFQNYTQVTRREI